MRYILCARAFKNGFKHKWIHLFLDKKFGQFNSIFKDRISYIRYFIEATESHIFLLLFLFGAVISIFLLHFVLAQQKQSTDHHRHRIWFAFIQMRFCVAWICCCCCCDWCWYVSPILIGYDHRKWCKPNTWDYLSWSVFQMSFIHLIDEFILIEFGLWVCVRRRSSYANFSRFYFYFFRIFSFGWFGVRLMRNSSIRRFIVVNMKCVCIVQVRLWTHIVSNKYNFMFVCWSTQVRLLPAEHSKYTGGFEQ